MSEINSTKQQINSYNGFTQGTYAARKGRLCFIKKIHFEMDPPAVTVQMMDTDTEVGTEFDKLQHLKRWYCSMCTAPNDDVNANKCGFCNFARKYTEKIEIEEQNEQQMKVKTDNDHQPQRKVEIEPEPEPEPEMEIESKSETDSGTDPEEEPEIEAEDEPQTQELPLSDHSSVEYEPTLKPMPRHCRHNGARPMAKHRCARRSHRPVRQMRQRPKSKLAMHDQVPQERYHPFGRPVFDDEMEPRKMQHPFFMDDEDDTMGANSFFRMPRSPFFSW